MTKTHIFIMLCALVITGCVSPASEKRQLKKQQAEKQETEKRHAELRKLCSDNSSASEDASQKDDVSKNSMDVVIQDRTNSYGVAAGAVTASGSLDPFVVAGPGIATSRGGAIALRGGSTDVEMIECKAAPGKTD